MLIVTLALGIMALTLLFVGSAVVTLEGFARVARRWRSLLGVGVVWAVFVGTGSMYFTESEVVAQLGAFPLWWRATGASALLIAVAVGLMHGILRKVSSATLAITVLALLGLGYALIVGASAQLAFALAPLVVSLAAAGLLALRRQRRNDGAPRGEAERLLRVLGLSLAPGVLLAAGLPEPVPEIAGAGGLLMGMLGAAVLLGLVPLAAAGLLDARERVEWFIAVRYLLAKRRPTFISVITGICVLGIAAGVWLIITVL